MSLNISVTDSAAARIAAVCARSGKAGLRIGLKGGGCAGFSYEMDLADAPGPQDEVIEAGGASVFVRPEAVMFLIGTVIDHEDGLLDSGFRFRNPNVSAACGCGESVSFKA